MLTMAYENQLAPQGVCGLDEVGRGALAGPVVTAGVILPPHADLPEVNDSKQIPKAKHEQIVHHILQVALAASVNGQSNRVVDALGINPAIRHSMTRVVHQLAIRPTALLIDGQAWQKLDLELPQQTLVKGDQKALSIACASLLAKYVHDQILHRMARQYPEYGWDTNAGYGTAEHLSAIQSYGYTIYHRRTYKPLSVPTFPLFPNPHNQRYDWK